MYLRIGIPEHERRARERERGMKKEYAEGTLTVWGIGDAVVFVVMYVNDNNNKKKQQ